MKKSRYRHLHLYDTSYMRKCVQVGTMFALKHFKTPRSLTIKHIKKLLKRVECLIPNILFM